MSHLAIIPARGGSKGIPGKNTALLCGKPLVAWTIGAAREASSVDRIVVSTDAPQIASIAAAHGAEVLCRPAELSGDATSSEAALLHALEELAESEAYFPELTIFLQCTSPLTTGEDIDATVAELYESRADSALAVAPFHHFLWRTGPQGGAAGINHDPRERLLRQQRADQYVETGAVYVMRTDGFREARHRFFGKTVCHEMPAARHLEIDEHTDLLVAETLLRRQLEQSREKLLPQQPAAVVFDFDGVFTDNRVWVHQNGTEAVCCDRSDGLGLRQLSASGISVLVLSRESNPVVKARCEKLELECLHGVQDKLPLLDRWLRERGIPLARTVYVGNDVNDVECMRSVGCGIAVADAYPEAKAAAEIVLSSKGGQGALREVTELLLRRKTASLDLQRAQLAPAWATRWSVQKEEMPCHGL